MDRRIPVVLAVIYAVVLAALAIAGLFTAFLVVAVIGGPVLSVMFWLRSRATTGSSAT